MVLYTKTSLKKSPKSHTQYLTIPASVVRDSQYPFENENEVELYVDPEKKIVILKKVGEKLEGVKKSG